MRRPLLPVGTAPAVGSRACRATRPSRWDPTAPPGGPGDSRRTASCLTASFQETVSISSATRSKVETMTSATTGVRVVEQRTAEARLLVADDDPNILELLSASLRFAGFDVATAKDG